MQINRNIRRSHAKVRLHIPEKNQRSRRHDEFRNGNGRGTKYRAVIKTEQPRATLTKRKSPARFGRTGGNSAVILLIFAAGFVGNGEPYFPLPDKRANYVRHQVVYRQPAFEILRCFRRYARCQ